MSICILKALEIISENIQKVSYEIIPIENVQERISADTVYASHSLPTYNNSAMDGYGVKLLDANQKVKVVDCILAGSSKQPTFSNGECIKVMTGSRVPSSVEAIVPLELVQVIDDTHIVLPKKLSKNQHVRFLGEDIKQGEKILHEGEALNFANITLLSSQGITHVKVYRQPKISVFSSGEELKLHYEQIEDWQVYNSNTPTLLERAKELGADVSFAGMAKDSVESLREVIANSLHADLIITSGGVSVGEADFTKEAFQSFDMDILIDGIDIKPGKPTLFGKIGNTYVLNLPGNPLAAALIFEILGKISLQILSGNNNIHHNTLVCKLSENLHIKKGRTTIIPGLFDGEFFTPSAKRLPGMVGVLHNCNAMLLLHKDRDFIAKNESIKILPINWKFFTSEQKNFLN
jgi:molybdopterin molybdotransferase